MKIGIVGGIGPESTIDYYKSIISEYQKLKGNDSYPQMVIDSVNMNEMLGFMMRKELDSLTDMLIGAVKNLQNAKADFAVIASNTPHIVFDKVRELSPIHVLSIVEETCKRANQLKYKKLGLLGTGFTMKETFYQDHFRKNGIEVVVPDLSEQEYVHDKIFSELEFGRVEKNTKDQFLQIVNRMIDKNGIEALILGCTELPLIIKPNDCNIPLLNTVEIHVQSIIDEIKKRES